MLELKKIKESPNEKTLNSKLTKLTKKHYYE